jgi:hypothetical protein
MLPSRVTRTARSALIVAASMASIVAFGGSSISADDASRKVGLILSHLPPASSTEYRSLRKIAGKADGQSLEMTKAEMWNVPEAEVDALIAAAARQGVTVTRLDATWNHTLAPMKAESEMSPEQKAMMHEMTDSKAVMGMSMMALPDASVLEYALTKDMHSADPDVPGPVLVIPLNDKLSVTARRTGIAKTPENYIWHGRIEATEEPVTLLWWPSGRLTGSVTYEGHVFAVKSIGAGMHGVIETAPNELPPEHAPMGHDMQEKMNMEMDPLVHKGDASMLRQSPKPEKDTGSDKPDRSSTKNLEDAPLNERARSEKLALAIEQPKAKKRKAQDVVISVLVAYTKASASHYSNIETDLIALAIEDANQSFRDSGIGQVRLELAHAYETDYVEKGSHFDHVFRFADKGDGTMEEVHALRDQYRADVAVLIVHDPQGCGLAAQVVAPADRAFAVVHHECAATTYSLAHEIGHLIGARHDLALDDGMEPFPYGHGYVLGTKWRTMMSYKESCDGCPRVPVWSNPAIKIHGERAGDDKANNARVIAEQAARVAAFR